MDNLPSQYDPKEVENKWYDKWEKAGVFHADDKSDAPPYTIVIPPPNVTGVLHIGHALNNTLQDILIRYKRMDGYNTLWMPGMDHAGIATQNVVERELMKEGIKRQDIGREKFVERVWEWKKKSGGAIVNQLKRLGSSLDWERERFTMDEGLSKAVREVFVRLYNEGLIYKGQYMINWCPRCHTALSDLEVEHSERAGHMWHIRYPVENSDQQFVIATTRPETLLGDTAVAVHPDDERYKTVVGKNVILPIVGRKIPIIADEYVDMEFGSGALKITPAHDPNDFEIGNKHKLERIKVIGDDGHMLPEAGAPYAGEERFKARKMIVKELESQGLLEKIEDHRHSVGECYRCMSVVEPNVSKQWFVKVAPLAKPAIEVVKTGKVKFVPKNWENTYFEWMNNIRDWCISRQIWWGHRIPAFTCADCGKMMVVIEDPEKCAKCGSGNIMQETDVLDTWFSSALWPFSTLGWPEDEAEATVKTFYPTSTLVTSFDIIFFWVARMIMMGLKFRGEIPFKEIYIHALVRDAKGQKMSKSKGNTIDPILIMDKHGADSMRMTLTALAAQGRDIKLSEERIEGYRHFINKLWNASRFALMNLEGFDFTKVDVKRDDLDLADRWILSRLNDVTSGVRKALGEYRFNEVASLLYQFTWGEFCDWYLEMIKPRLTGKEPGGDAARHTLAHTLETLLRLLHPIIPFITEELWQKVKPSGDLVAQAKYPKADENMRDEKIESDMKALMGATVAIRNIRGELGIKPSILLRAKVLADKNQHIKEVLARQRPFINKLANVELEFIDDIGQKPANSAVGVIEDVEIFVDLEGMSLLDEKKAKEAKELAKLEKEIAFFTKKLSNAKYVENAPAKVVEGDKAKLESYRGKAEKLKEHLAT